MPKVLIVEDDEVTAGGIAAHLQGQGLDVMIATDGPTGFACAKSGRCDVMVLDRMLPGCDGLSVLTALRLEGNGTPALILSALGDVDERIRGLSAGGDDYLTKPFSMFELAARIEALLRRPAYARETLLSLGPLKLDLLTSEAERGGRLLDLLAREFKLLEYMVRRPGQVITPAMLFRDVWHYNFLPRSNVLHVHMGRLRARFETGWQGRR